MNKTADFIKTLKIFLQYESLIICSMQKYLFLKLQKFFILTEILQISKHLNM